MLISGNDILLYFQLFMYVLVMKKLNVSFIILILCVFVIQACSTVVKLPEQMKLENAEHLADSSKVFSNHSELVKANINQCIPEKAHWSWDKIILNQLSYVIQTRGMGDKLQGRTFAQVLCADGVRENEHILKVMQDTSDLSSSEEKNEGIYKLGFIPIKVTAYLANGEVIPTKVNRTLLSKNLVSTFLEFEKVPTNSFVLVVEIDQSFDPKKAVKLETSTSAFGGSTEHHYEFYAYSSGIVHATWVGAQSQLFIDSKVLEKSEMSKATKTAI